MDVYEYDTLSKVILKTRIKLNDQCISQQQ